MFQNDPNQGRGMEEREARLFKYKNKKVFQMGKAWKNRIVFSMKMNVFNPKFFNSCRFLAEH